VEAEGVHRAGIIGSDFEKQMIAGTPLGRLGQPEDIVLWSSENGHKIKLPVRFFRTHWD
jgi:hypothetical protein